MIPGASPSTRIVLLGLMGSGKTTIGRALSERTGWPLRDSDVALLDSTGQTAREIRDSAGTDALHDAEAQALLDAIAAPGPSIVAAAASTIQDAGAREALSVPGVIPIWLRAAPATLAGRFASGAHRPVFGPDAEAVARAQARIRDPLFAAQDPIVIDVDGRTTPEIEEAALDGIRERLRTLRRPA